MREDHAAGMISAARAEGPGTDQCPDAGATISGNSFFQTASRSLDRPGGETLST
jgi:hypothetical protein